MSAAYVGEWRRGGVEEGRTEADAGFGCGDEEVVVGCGGGGGVGAEEAGEERGGGFDGCWPQ